MENQGLPKVLVLGLVGIILLFIFGSSMFVTIHPGEKGVKFKRFGGGLDKEKIYDQGFKIIAPWDNMIVYDVRETETFEKMEVLSKNGLSIKIDLSIIHHPLHDEIGHLHDNIGNNYLEKIIKPAVRSVTREVIGNYLHYKVNLHQYELIRPCSVYECYFLYIRLNLIMRKIPALSAMPSCVTRLFTRWSTTVKC